jgi:hypothetical protein
MYLRQSNKWKEYLLQEAIEQTGLPLEIVAMIRDANSTDGPVPEKVLTSIGTLARSQDNSEPILSTEDSDWGDESLPPVYVSVGEILAEIPKKLRGDLIMTLINFISTPRSKSEKYTLLGVNRFRKKYAKMIKKAGYAAESEEINNVILERMKLWTQSYVMPYVKDLIKVYVLDPAAYKEAISFASKHSEGRRLAAAGLTASKILNREQEDPDNILHKFDNGYYWYDIRSSACNTEGEKMGHCGQGMKGGNLYSLRSPSGTSINPDPHVTIEMDADKTVWQVKGRANMTPKKKYWPYISWFLANMGAKNYREDRSGDASKEMIEYLEKASPDIFRQSFIEYAQETGDDWEEATKALLELDNISKNTMNVTAPFDLAGTTLDYDYLRVDYKLLYQADLPDESYNLRAEFKLFRNLKDSLESNFIAKHFSSEIFGVTPKVRVSPVVIDDGARLDPWGSERATALETTLTWYFRFEALPVSADQATQEEAKKAFAVTIKNANKLVNRLIDVEKGDYEFAAEDRPSALEGFDLDGFEMDLQNFYDSKGLAKKEPKKRFDYRRVTERWSRIVK